MTDESETATWRTMPNPMGGWWVTCLEHPAQYVSVAGEHLIKRFQLQYHYEADALVERLNQARRVPGLVKALEAAANVLGQASLALGGLTPVEWEHPSVVVAQAHNAARAALMDAEVNDD